MAPGFREGRPEGRPPRPTQQPGAASAPPPSAAPSVPQGPAPSERPAPRNPQPERPAARAARAGETRCGSRYAATRRLRVSPTAPASPAQRPTPTAAPSAKRGAVPLLRQRQLRRLHPLQLRSRHRQPGPHPLPRLNPVREAGRLSPRNPFPDKRRRKLSPDKSLRAQRGASTAVPCRRPISPNAESKIFAASAASAARKAVVG